MGHSRIKRAVENQIAREKSEKSEIQDGGKSTKQGQGTERAYIETLELRDVLINRTLPY